MGSKQFVDIDHRRGKKYNSGRIPESSDDLLSGKKLTFVEKYVFLCPSFDLGIIILHDQTTLFSHYLPHGKNIGAELFRNIRN